MRFKILILLLLGSSIDFGPDDPFNLKYDLCYDEIGIIIMEFIEKCYIAWCDLSRLILNEIVYPTVDVISWNLINIHHYFRHNLYIWLLFFEHSIFYRHTASGVRSYFHFRRAFFVRSVTVARCVLLILYTSCVLDTGTFVPQGNNSYYWVSNFSLRFFISGNKS